MRRLVGVCVLSALLAAGADGQDGARAAAAARTGTVTGHVICGDTQLPARFAEVSLIRKPSQAEVDALYAPAGKEDAAEKKPPVQSPTSYAVMQEATGIDGGFTIRRVPPGEYWIVAKREGYLFPIAAAVDEKSGHDLNRRMASAQSVHVGTDGAVKADIRLERGGVITGRVVFGDGSAAVQWEVWLVAAAARTVFSPNTEYVGISRAFDDERVGFTWTDDEGNFRIAGVAPGKYVVVTQVLLEGSSRVADESSTPESSGGQDLLLFGPGVFRRQQAAVLEIHGAEHVTADDVRLDFDSLHTIRGRVLAKVDGLPVHGTFVNVLGDGEGGPDFSRRAVMDAEGSFYADFLPAGNYTVQVVPGLPSLGSGRPAHFEHPSVAVVLENSDVTVPDILLGERDQIKPPTQSAAPKPAVR